MTGICEAKAHPVGDREGPVVVQPDKLAHGHLRILGRVQGSDRRLPLLDPLLGNELRIRPLDLGRVGQHHCGQIPRGEGRVDVPPEALTTEVRQVSAVIDMCVAEHDGVQRGGIKGKPAVALDRFVPVALIKAAFHQDSASVDLNEVHRSSGGPGGSKEVDVHAEDCGRKRGTLQA